MIQIPSPELATRVSEEFERLSGRPLTEFERAALLQIHAGQSLWVEGLKPEALGHMAVAVSQALGRRVLFVSPDADLLAQRQHRLGARAAAHLLPESGPVRLPTATATLFVSSQGLGNPALWSALEAQPPELLFLESAHAATPLAFEYRSSMEHFAALRTRLKNPRVVAAATHSSGEVEQAARSALGLDDAVVLRHAPSGVSLQILKEDPRRSMAALVEPLPRPALLLCSTPAQADAVYAELLDAQLPCHRYHAGLAAKDRATELLQFALPGRRAILVATSSFGAASGLAGDNDAGLSEDFGRGYGRADLRSIVHVGMPSSLEQYGQELGLLRAVETREGPGYALAIFGRSHLLLTHQLLERKRPCPETLASVVVELTKVARGAFRSQAALVESLGGAERAVSLVLRFLKDAGAVEYAAGPGPIQVRAVSLTKLRAAESELTVAFATLRERDTLRLDQLEQFAQSEGCRLAALGQALGHDWSNGCGICDRCDPERGVEGGSLLSKERLSKERGQQRRAPATILRTSADDSWLDQDEGSDDDVLEVGFLS